MSRVTASAVPCISPGGYRGPSSLTADACLIVDAYQLPLSYSRARRLAVRYHREVAAKGVTLADFLRNAAAMDVELRTLGGDAA